MVILLILVINIGILDYICIKYLKSLKNALKINDTISAYDFEGDFWDEEG